MDESIRHRFICLVFRRATDGERVKPLVYVACSGAAARGISRKLTLANLLRRLPVSDAIDVHLLHLRRELFRYRLQGPLLRVGVLGSFRGRVHVRD
jgi:hypothetical protein